jgi:hypothetical protein
MKSGKLLSVLAGLLLLISSWVGVEAGEKPLKVRDLAVEGVIDGQNIAFTVKFSVKVPRNGREIPLVTGDMVLDELLTPKKNISVRFDSKTSTYFLKFMRAGLHKVSARFAARPRLLNKGPWREASFAIPASRVRELQVVCDRRDLEVVFPAAMRLEREVVKEKLTVKAVLGPGRPFCVRWKPQVREMDSTLVLASEANIIATASAGALRMDTLFVFAISQGKMKEISFNIPANTSVTQVRGAYIRDWRVLVAGKKKVLKVVLSRPQVKQYALQVQSEVSLPEFPTEINLPVIEPEGGIRSSGHLALGTDSAIHMVVKRSGGLTQNDSREFPRMVLERKHSRPLPKNNAFYFSYAATPYQMKLALDDIVPACDVNQRLVVNVRKDDLSIGVSLNLDVRDAAIRSLMVDVPSNFLVSSVKGSLVADHQVFEGVAGQPQKLEIHFRKPLLGQTLIAIRLELGKSPLGSEQILRGLSVAKAKNQRGSLVLVGERGISLKPPKTEKMREVHVESVPMRVANAQFAYRFRETDWSLKLLATEHQAGIRAEAFHLVSIGEGIVYGSVVVNYFISGAPVDELYFRIPKGLKNVEFVGSDVQRWVAEGNIMKVKLQRKIIGDYNIGLTHTQRYEAGTGILIGGVEPVGAETQTGYICVASHLNLKLEPKGKPDANILEIDRTEIPANYRLLVNAPMLKTYKYMNSPHSLNVGIKSYQRARLLPVVVEVMQIETQLAVGEKRGMESVTRVRYKVKNSSTQFLTLEMPAGAAVWSTHLVDNQTGARKRVMSSFDKTAGLLKIPLKRLRNPNEPVTVELEYGQGHGDLSWSGNILLAAPRSQVRSTYAQWVLRTPRDWSLLPGAGSGNMVPQKITEPGAGIASVTYAAMRIWEHGITLFLHSGYFVLSGIVGLILLSITFYRKRSKLPGMLLWMVLAVALMCSVLAASRAEFSSFFASKEGLTALAYTQTLSLDEKVPLEISASVVPAWRRGAGVGSLVYGPIVSAGFLLIAFVMFLKWPGWKFARSLLLAVGLTGLLCSLAQIPAMSLTLGHVFTWGLPALVMLYMFLGVIFKRRALVAATAMVLIAATFTSGCVQSSSLQAFRTGNHVLDQVDCQLAAEKDSIAVELRLRFAASEPISFPLGNPAMILLSPEKISDQIKIEEQGGRYQVRVLKKGRYDFVVKLLSPLSKASAAGVRSFKMPLPGALTNRVELAVPETGMQIEAPTAIRLTRKETEKATFANVILGPNDPVVFIWRPRTRLTKLEKTVFFVEATSLFRFSGGLAEGRHRLRFQIAQGELSIIRLKIPGKAAVTAVEGRGLGAWRFDPASRQLEARLTAAFSGDYEMLVVTQVPGEGLPATMELGTLQVLEAVRQRSTIGLTTDPSVFLQVLKHPHKMSVDDFAREAATVSGDARFPKTSGIRYAYRTSRSGDVISVKVFEVKPEIRAHEVAGFWIGDEHMTYDTGAKGGLTISVAKAGVFSISMKLPEGYDIDTLSAPQVSHWDETGVGKDRKVRIHFKQKLRGTVVLKLALSQSFTEMPQQVVMPRIRVEGALKHTGQVSVSAARGIRVSEIERAGVSSINPLELDRRLRGALVYKLLKPEWKLLLKTEVIEPRINVNFLHVAKVTEGLVRHTHYLRYRLYNAGSKVFEVDVPAEAIGLLISGSEIARTSEVSPGRWRVELTRKKFDQPYLLTLRYETRFDHKGGRILLAPVKATGVDLQKGHVLALASDRVELAELTRGEVLQTAEARNISAMFGAGDLSDAAFCYSSSVPGYKLVLGAKRHQAAAVLEAKVVSTEINTVVSEHGDNINKVKMQLRVGGKRNLEVLLPAGARIWSLMINGRSMAPSERAGSGTSKVLLIPLPQISSGELVANLEFVYVVPRGKRRVDLNFEGPRFDLPLKSVKWKFFMPDGYDYQEFKGTLAVNRQQLKMRQRSYYSMQRYREQNKAANIAQEKKVDLYQSEAKRLARKGQQYAARYALKNAYNHSFNNKARNEDAKVQLHKLIQGQAFVGLVGRRGHLRPKAGEMDNQQTSQAGGIFDLGDRFNQAEADRLRSSLSKADNDNLELITKNIIETQDAAAGGAAQIAISMPLRGLIIEFDRPLQVKPNTEMQVSFIRSQQLNSRIMDNRLWTAGLFACLLGLLMFLPVGKRGLKALGEKISRREVQAVEEVSSDKYSDIGPSGLTAEELAAAERAVRELENRISHDQADESSEESQGDDEEVGSE